MLQKRSIPVAKMHGARNDFIVIDARTNPVNDAPFLAGRLCDRHAGIGADGLLLIENAASGGVAMRVVNADGSEAEMCGNGVRCVARYLDEKGEGGELDIATAAGPIHASVIERGATYRIRVDMGTPRVVETDLPIKDALVVDTGNPHLVLFREGFEEIDLLMFGERMQTHALFPQGVNVHTALIRERDAMVVRHYERGAGLTMACGTGAVASVAAAMHRGAVSAPVTVHVPGGELTIEIGADGRAFMTGPAVHVFDTTIE